MMPSQILPAVPVPVAVQQPQPLQSAIRKQQAAKDKDPSSSKSSNKCRRCGANRYRDDGHREARAWCPTTHTFGDRTNDAGRGQGEKLAVLARGWSFPGPIVVDSSSGTEVVQVLDDPTWTATDDAEIMCASPPAPGRVAARPAAAARTPRA
jgi:hypothetical protein